MSIDHKRIKEIEELSPPERISGYLYYSAKLSMLGAKLRKDNRDDSSWTPEEEEEWETIGEEIEPWWYALSKEEKEAISAVEIIMGSLTRGEWPVDLS